MPRLKVNGVAIDDTFAEAFGMRATAIVITAPNRKWARQAAVSMTGFATSVIGCGCEAAIDVELAPSETPDGRPGCRVMIFAVSTDELQKQLQNRVGQCVLTSPGSACFAGMDGPNQLKLGAALRYFGDGWQISKKLGGRHFWRVPVMDGEFVCEATVGMTKEAAICCCWPAATPRHWWLRKLPWRRSTRCAAPSCRSRAASCARVRRSAANTRV
jgi:formylmethanofuran--tetrahydromethanopterin N-formyltransferase